MSAPSGALTYRPLLAALRRGRGRRDATRLDEEYRFGRLTNRMDELEEHTTSRIMNKIGSEVHRSLLVSLVSSKPSKPRMGRLSPTIDCYGAHDTRAYQI